jgi:hypothetical protein
MAVNAIIQLYRVLGGDQTSKLSGQILVFSVSHTNEQIKIYGHYAIIEGAKVTFHRYRIKTFNLGPGEDIGSRKKTYDFVREVYGKFYLEHLKRIQDALAKMENPRAMSIDESESQGRDSSAPSSGRTANLDELALIREQMALDEKQHKEQMAQQEKQHKEQMAQQEKQHKEQMAQQEKQYKEQIELLKQLLNRP